jgi:hypothetical protein
MSATTFGCFIFESICRVDGQIIKYYTTQQDPNNQDNSLVIKLSCLNSRSYIPFESTGRLMMNVEGREVVFSLEELEPGSSSIEFSTMILGSFSCTVFIQDVIHNIERDDGCE